MSIVMPRPVYQKGAKKATKPRKGMRKVSSKRAKQHASPDGKAGLRHMGLVRTLPCIGCGTTHNVKAHHCKDKPPLKMQWIYQKLPYGCKSGPRDTIPLCEPDCHNGGPNSYHVNRPEFHRRNGFDYLHILATRAAVDAMTAEIDF